MKSPTDVFCGLFVIFLSGIGWLSVRTLPDPTDIDLFGPGSLPRLILVLLAVSGLLLVVTGWRHAPLRSYWPEMTILKRTMVAAGTFIGYLAAMVLLHDFFNSFSSFPFQNGLAFSVSTFLFLVTLLWQLGRRSRMEVFLVSAGTTGSLVFVFFSMFDVILP